MTEPAVITEFTAADLTEVGTLELRSGDYWFLGGELHRISKLTADDRGVTFVCRGQRVTVLEWGQRQTIRRRPPAADHLGLAARGKGFAVSHVVSTDRPWYAGMTARSLCGVRCDVLQAEVNPSRDNLCERCARSLRRRPSGAGAELQADGGA